MRWSPAIAAAAPLAIAGAVPGAAQYPPPAVALQASVSPTASGSPRAPRRSALHLTVANGAESRAIVDQIVLLTPRHVRIRPGVMAGRYCPYTRIAAHGVGACPAGSRVGGGSASAALGDGLEATYFTVRAFAGSDRELAIHLESVAHGIRASFAAAMGRAGSPYRGKLAMTMPPQLQRRLGEPVYLTRLTLRLERTIGGRGLVTTVGCPGDRQHRHEARLHFVPNPNAAPADYAAQRATSACR